MRWRANRSHVTRARRYRARRAPATSIVDMESMRVADELSDARNLIVQLQRELERAREVIEQQQAAIFRASAHAGKNGGGR